MSEPRHPVGPEIDDSGNPTTVAPDDQGAQPAADTGWGNDTAGSEAGGQSGASDFAGGADSAGGDGDSAGGRRPISGRDMLTQLQAMIDSLAVQATPVMREVAAKAAELAAVAGQKAGPIAHRAAEATEKVGERVAARSKEMAADLRRPKDAAGPGAEPAADQPPTSFEDDEQGG